MSVKDYQLEAALNVSISGINIAEGCPPSGINDAIRQLMADARAESNARQQAEARNAQAIEEGVAQAVEQAAAQSSQGIEALGSALRSEMEDAVAGVAASATSADAALESTLRNLVASEKAALQSQIQNSLPVGTVIAFAANAAPDGFLICNGAAVSRTTYAALFSAIGTTYGAGDGSTTFAVPNLKDKFIQGSGTAGTSIAAGLPDHKHQLDHTLAYYYSTTGDESFYTVKHNTASGELPDKARGKMSYASAANSIYGKSSTVQPPALTMRYYIKY